MVIVCVSDPLERVHGFLRSCMLNPHPGVYLSVKLDGGSRDRIWKILVDWWNAEPRGTILMLYNDKKQPMGIAMRSLGAPRRTIESLEGIHVLLRKAKQSDNDAPESIDS